MINMVIDLAFQGTLNVTEGSTPEVCKLRFKFRCVGNKAGGNVTRLQRERNFFFLREQT